MLDSMMRTRKKKRYIKLTYDTNYLLILVIRAHQSTNHLVKRKIQLLAYRSRSLFQKHVEKQFCNKRNWLKRPKNVKRNWKRNWRPERNNPMTCLPKNSDVNRKKVD